ncbi:MAG: hypothetical protein LBH37_02730 [Oscillospiraceae bacterium]|nr:hypothetical protein [Oscillospiraceae bacterium]
MTLKYLREYKVYFHIGSSFGILEFIVLQKHKIGPEDTLVKSKVFSLFGKEISFR